MEKRPTEEHNVVLLENPEILLVLWNHNNHHLRPQIVPILSIISQTVLFFPSFLRLILILSTLHIISFKRSPSFIFFTIHFTHLSSSPCMSHPSTNSVLPDFTTRIKFHEKLRTSNEGHI